eukprot:4945246-Karenia_brevis.AAC.1
MDGILAHPLIYWVLPWGRTNALDHLVHHIKCVRVFLDPQCMPLLMVFRPQITGMPVMLPPNGGSCG